MKRYYFTRTVGEIIDAENEEQARERLSYYVYDADEYAVASVEDA